MVMTTTATSVTGEPTWSGVFPGVGRTVSGDRVGCIVPCDRMGCDRVDCTVSCDRVGCTVPCDRMGSDRVGLTVSRIEVVVGPCCCVGI